nr:hypothetical protein [Corynebacterium sp. CNJ-954]
MDHGHPNPRHYLWADYLRWAAEKSRMTLVHGQVTRIGLRADSARDGSSRGWSLSVDRIDGTSSRLEADA